MTDTTILAIDLGKYKCVACVYHKAAGRVEMRPNPHRFAAFHVLRRAGSSVT